MLIISMEDQFPFSEMPPDEGLWDVGAILSPYQPTLDENLVAMLAKIGLGIEDVLIDLGSGDGRVLLHAAFLQCRLAIGYELNEQLLTKSRSEVSELGLENSIKIFAKDLLEADISEVTVVYMYLLPEAIQKLRGLLDEAFNQKTKVIVSHHFPIPWLVGENFMNYYIYYKPN